MKIAFLEPHLKVFGGIRRILELSNRLVQRGHAVTIFHSDGTPCTWMECRAETRPATDIVNGDHDVLIYNDPTKHDLELAQHANARLKVFFCLELYRKELMLPGLHMEKLALWNYEITRTLYLKKALLRHDLVLVNASWMKTWLQDNLGLETTLLLGGINKDMFHPVHSVKEPNVIRILYSGDPRARKGTPVIEDARKIVEACMPNVEFFTYAGKGIPQSQMAEVYSSADIFVDGQFSAGWNNPVVEAMACRVPVVCTDIGGVQDFAFHEQTALLVPPRSSEAMAAAILRLARDSKLRQALAENAFQYIQKFDWDESAKKLESILEDALEQLTFNRSYIKHRPDIARLVPTSVKRVLDVGCSTGTLGSYLKDRNGANVVGIELDPQMAFHAAKRLDQVIECNLEELVWEDHFETGQFDCIIFADLLEHLKDPWRQLRYAHSFLAPHGVVIASIPNVAHISTSARLLFRQEWPYRSRGIHDRTHLRFFTLHTIREMFAEAGFSIQRVDRNYRFIDQPRGINRFAKFVARFGLQTQFTYQYLIRATKL